MWWKIAKLAGLFFLGFGAAQDIKYQKISTEYLLAGSCAAILYHFLWLRWQQEQAFGAENGNGRQECRFILFF